jgi:bacterioferritin-associated ferredoxin
VKVCICFNVSDKVIRERTRAGQSLEAILAETKAGSGCGTCLLAIRRIHAGESAAVAPCRKAGGAQKAA